jgi:Protein of unknown function (DUF2846)
LAARPRLPRFPGPLAACVSAWVLLALAALCAGRAGAAGAEGAAALALPIPPGKALVYLLRPSEFGPAIPIQVFANDRAIGATLAQSFYVIEAAPGDLRLASKADNTAELVLHVQAGRRYYVLQGARVGVLSAMTSLQVAPEFLGREGVEASHQAGYVKL